MKNKLKTKAAGIWSSVNNPGTGAGYYSGITNDWQLLSIYVNNDTVHAAVSLIAGAVASTGFGLFEIPQNSKAKKSKQIIAEPTEITQSPILDLLHNSDEMLHAHDMFRLAATYLMVCGRAYIYIERDVTGTPTALKVLIPPWVEPYRAIDGTIQSYFYLMPSAKNNLTRQKMEIDIKDMIDIRFPSPSDPYGGGDSPVRSAWLKASLSNKMLQYQDSLLDNRARVDQIFIPKGEISSDEAKVLEKKFNDKFRGSQGNGKTLIAESAGTLVPLKYPPQDLASLQIDHELKKAICSVLFIPIALLEESPNRAGIQGSLQQFQQLAVRPLVHLIESKLNRKLVSPISPNQKIIFADCVDIDADFAAQQQQLKIENTLNSFKAGAMSINEYRATINLPPIVNGDDIILPPATTPQSPEGLPEDEPKPVIEPLPEPEPAKSIDVNLILKINEKVYSHELPRATAISLAAVATGESEETIKNLIGYPSSANPAGTACHCVACQNKTADTSTEAPATQPEASNAAEIKENAPDSPKEGCPVPEGSELIEPMLRLYEFAHIAISEQIPSIAARLESAGITSGKAANMPEDENQDMPQDDDFIYIDQWDSRVEKKIMPVIEMYAEQGLKYFLSRVGGDPSMPAVVPQKINEAMKLSTMKLAQSTMQTTLHDVNTAKNELREQIKQGIFTGDTVVELGKRVNSVFAGLDATHARMIGQTEASRAIHNGLRIAAKESGLVSGFKFLASSDACPICLGLDGTTIDIETKQFTPNDYDDSMLPVHPNCRCTVTDILK